MAEPAFLFITIDATDAPAAAAFWSGLLGTGIDAAGDQPLPDVVEQRACSAR